MTAMNNNRDGKGSDDANSPPPHTAVSLKTSDMVLINNLANGISRLSVIDNPPPENPRIEDVEKIAATEMNHLSMESREQILYDLHGISEKAPKETSGFLQSKLMEMQNALDEIDDLEKDAYNLALLIDPSYVRNSMFRLKFLRADLFDSNHAAQRCTKHFQAKLELFGRDLLCKDITQDDLDEDETLDCLYSPWIQELPVRDSSNRLVSVMIQKAKDTKWSVVAKCRAIWYRRMMNTDEIETQRNGVVWIIFNSEDETDRTSVWKVGRMITCLPIRFVGFHMCYPPEYYEKQGPTMSLARMAMESQQRHRHRTHTGSLAEIKYKLQTFGIPVSALPITDDGVYNSEYNQKSMKNQRTVEQQRSASPAMTTGNLSQSDLLAPSFLQQPQRQQQHLEQPVLIMTPGKYDVLMGRGRSSQDHVGNVRFRFMIEQNLERYDSTPKQLKTSIALEILNEIHDLGGRFLTPCDAGWKEIDEASAREKVSSCFRSFRKVKGQGKKDATIDPDVVHANRKRQSNFPDFTSFFADKESRMF